MNFFINFSNFKHKIAERFTKSLDFENININGVPATEWSLKKEKY